MHTNQVQPRVTRSISIRKDLAQAAQAQAAKENRSLSNLIETLLIAERDKRDGKAPKAKEARA